MAIFLQKRSNTAIYVYQSTSYWDKDKKQSRSKRKLLGRLDITKFAENHPGKKFTELTRPEKLALIEIKPLEHSKQEAPTTAYDTKRLIDKLEDEYTALLQTLVPAKARAKKLHKTILDMKKLHEELKHEEIKQKIAVEFLKNPELTDKEIHQLVLEHS